jgi:putative endonuclease
MAFYTYVLRSQVNGFIYIGSTTNLDRRLGLHNRGRVKSTKAFRPWQLLEKHSFSTRGQAYKYEMFLKTHQQKDRLKQIHKND